jgi:uncharacterized membrane protein
MNPTAKLDPADLTLLHELRVGRRRRRPAKIAAVSVLRPPADTGLGARMADRITALVGSWRFILVQSGLLLLWLSANVFAWVQAWDPYPFILLNLVLSCIAALQAPVIMMSQKRQEVKDRLRAENDYRVNLKAELEIRHLHEKLDYISSKQWQRLTEIQQIQMEIMQERGRTR